MSSQLDLATVLLMQQCSYIVGFFAFVYMRLASSRHPGLVPLALGFFVMTVASSLAGHGLLNNISTRIWTFGSLALGLWGYSLIWIGLHSVSRKQAKNKDYWLLLLPVPVLALALVTEYDLDDKLRSGVFNLAAAATLISSAFHFRKHKKSETLRSRRVLLLLTLSAGCLSGIIGINFLIPATQFFSHKTGFFVIIILNFALSLFIIMLIAERALREQRLQAVTDPLTGVFNRRYFFENYPETLRPTDAVMLLDLDHFKIINDRHGHLAGDLILQDLAARMSATLSPNDILARYGGEEFIAFLPDAGLERATRVAEKIRNAVCDSPVSANGLSIPVTLSIGIAMGGNKIEGLASLIELADQSLYAAKRGGRNRVCSANDHLAA